jgi:ferritin
MLGQAIQDRLNEQLKNEIYSSYLYLSMSAYFEANNLPGFAHWMRVQVQEEQEHAMGFYQFIRDRGGRVILQAIDQPPVDYQSPLDAFEKTLAHEQEVTSLIHGLCELAVQEKDYASQVFLQWFVTEQVEEEASATQIVETLRLIQDNVPALIMLDRELGRRGAD